jgi:tetratricopeptide (TPR) repeat protein
MANYEEALKYYQRSVEIKEDFLDGIYQLGLTYLTLGKNDEAITQFENYLKIDPDSEKANQVKGFLNYLRR